jgi:hypothetical protein
MQRTEVMLNPVSIVVFDSLPISAVRWGLVLGSIFVSLGVLGGSNMV